MVRMAQDLENQMSANPLIWKAPEDSQNPATGAHILLSSLCKHIPLAELPYPKLRTTLAFALSQPSLQSVKPSPTE